MPFQGNPNAGQPDPALLNLLFQQKQRREEMAYKQQQDALAAQRQAQIDAAEEARKERAAQIANANALFDLQSKVEAQSKTLGEAQATASSQVDKVAQAAPVSPQAAPIVNGEPLPAGTFPLMPQDETNALTQLQAQDQYLSPVLAQQAALANSLQGIPEVSGLVSQIPALGRQAFDTKTRLDQEALQKKLGEEGRSNAFAREQSKTAFDRSIDKAHIDATIAAGGDARKIVEMRREATKWAVVAQDTRLSPQARQYAQQMYTDLQNDIDADALRGISGEVMADNQRQRAALEDYTAIQRVHTVTKAMEARMRMGDLNHVGTRAQMTWWMKNIQGIIEDSTGVPFIDYYVGSVRDEINKAMKAGDVEYADRLEQEMLDDATLERVATGQLRDIDAAWVAVRMNNPSGRTSNLIYEDIKNVTETIGITISSALAGAKLRSNLRATAAALEDKRNLLHQQWPKLQFDLQSGAWIPATKLEAADDALFADPMTQAVTNRVNRANPNSLSPSETEKALEWIRKNEGR